MTPKRKTAAKSAKRPSPAKGKSPPAKPVKKAQPPAAKAEPKPKRVPKSMTVTPASEPPSPPVPPTAEAAPAPVVAPKPKRAPKAEVAAPAEATAPKPPKAPPLPKAAPAPPPPIIASVDVQAPAHRVWAALTSPDEVNRWFTERCEFEARPNGRVLYCWYSTPATLPDYVKPSRFGNAAEARIEIWEPRKRFTVRPMSLWPGTVTFRLDEIPQGTKVTVEHADWPKKDDWYRAHVDGWADFLDYLRHYLEMPEAAYDVYVAKKEKAAASS